MLSWTNKRVVSASCILAQPDQLNYWLCKFMLGARKENGEGYPPNTLSSFCVPSNLYLILIVAFNEIMMSLSTSTSTLADNKCVDFHHKFSIFNRSCAVATIFSSLACLSSSILHGQPEPFGSCIILQSCSSFSSVSMANLSYLRATTFYSLRLLSNSFTSPRFNLLRVARRCYSGFLFLIFASYPQPFFPLSFSSLKLCLL